MQSIALDAEFSASCSFCWSFSSSVITLSSEKFHALRAPYFEFRLKRLSFLFIVFIRVEGPKS